MVGGNHWRERGRDVEYSPFAVQIAGVPIPYLSAQEMNQVKQGPDLEEVGRTLAKSSDVNSSMKSIPHGLVGEYIHK